MKNFIENTEEIFDRLNGFHALEPVKPFSLSYVSDSLSEMLGYSKNELLGMPYEAIVYDSDKKIYSDFIYELSSKASSLSAEYRLLKKDGTVIYVKDSSFLVTLPSGKTAAYSTLTDVTALKAENESMSFLKETVSLGFIRYTCEKQPRVTYINEQMLRMLRMPKDWCDAKNPMSIYMDNIYLMVPVEKREKFAKFLEKAMNISSPISGETSVLRCDGTVARLYGWVTKCKNEKGEEEFHSVCMDVTERYNAEKESEAKKYQKALTDVYDTIFEYNLSSYTVKCLYAENSGIFKSIVGVPMQANEATDKWIESAVIEADRERVREFFDDFFDGKSASSSHILPQIKYFAHSSDGTVKAYTAVFLQIDSKTSLFCCRCMPEHAEALTLKNENLSLKNINENMQELVMRFTDGIAAFEIVGNSVTPHYASDNVCEFFGFSKEEWLGMMKKTTSIKDFVSRSDVAYEEFIELLENGEAEFTYCDVKTQSVKRIKAICSQKSPGGTMPRYVMLYKINDEPKESVINPSDEQTVNIRTFGYFDVFIGEKPVNFRNKKAKELLALLVDRRGGYISSDEAISFLWEDEPSNSVTLARYRKVALRLKNTLEEYGISDIVESVDGKRRIVPNLVKCDLYDYLSGKEEYSQLFKGSYLTNYSWGEITLGELMNKIIY